jgi:tetratricopeptide (TPR) repeat protein
MPHPLRIALATSILVSTFVSRSAPAASEPSPLAELDAAWARRADGAAGGTAREGSVEPVLAAGRAVLASTPGALEARWKLMRALYFKGEHATAGNAAKRAVFDEGKALGEETLDLIRREAGAAAGKDLSTATPVELVEHVKGRPEVAPCFLWAAVNWGKWALVFGKTAAARQGAAAKIRDYATAVVRLDPSYDEGGGYRVLGRLHHQTPAIPFVTGWASRAEALRNLRLAVEAAPRNFVNRLYLAEALWDYEKGKRPEARRMLEDLAGDTPSAALAVEDARAQEDARALLAAWGKG